MQPLRFLARLAALVALALSSGHAWVQAAEGRYNVVLAIDEPLLRTLIERHVQIFSEHTDPLLSEDRFHYLARIAVQEIGQLLSTEGYFTPVIEHRIESAGSRLTASYAVTPGRPALVSAVDFRFAGAIREDTSANRALRERLTGSWPLTQGAVLRSADWEKAKEDVLRTLHAERYAAAFIADSAAVVDPARHSADLRVVVDSGPAFTFGELEISGLEHFPRSVVAAHNPIRPGTAYSEQALADFQAILQSTGYFTSVFVSIAAEPERAERSPIRVQVVENTRKRLSLGAGYSTDTGFGVLARYDGALLALPGWRARATLELAQVEQSVQGELQLPPLTRSFVPKLGMRLRHEDLEGQTTVSSVFGARLVRTRQDTELALSAQLYSERREIGMRVDHLKSFPLNASGTLRRLDDVLFPQRGYSFNLQLGGALEETLSDRRFLRLYGKANYFLPIGGASTLILRGELGGVKAGGRDGIPDDFLFRAGGSQSVRGYSFGALGVRSADAIVRGRYLAVASAELRQRVAPDWWAAAFYDTGGVADSFSAIDRVAGYGVGARWRSPLGPINVDLAYGEAARDLRLHFSVGYAF